MNETNRIFFKSNKIPKMKYPHVLDEKLQKKITLKKEFQMPFVAKKSDIVKEDAKGTLCMSSDFELAPHQEFVKAYLSKHTPYNGLLLYHGMGSGKTCSAIGITEEFRKHHKYDLQKRKIYIVASPNVQKNFKLQLFNPDELVQENGLWKMRRSCIGNTLLQELDLFQVKKKEDVIRKIKGLIRNYYVFVGYSKFANIIEELMKNDFRDNDVKPSNQVVTKRIKQKLRDQFTGHMIVIDEVHNVRNIGATSEGKKVSDTLNKLVTHVKYMKLLFLSGTPMYNDPKEIVFLLNLLHKNDGLSPLKMSDVFNKKNELQPKGKDILLHAANGYISYVRGEDPYHFPFKVFPDDFDKKKSILDQTKSGAYPPKQFNKKKITTPMQALDLYVNTMSAYQSQGYQTIVGELFQKGFTRTTKNGSVKKYDYSDIENMDSFSYTFLQVPINALTLCIQNSDNTFVTGKEALDTIGTMNRGGTFEYNDGFEKTFHMDTIQQYSSKIHSILNSIVDSEGIVLIYSQYLDSGLIPMALALEEMGFGRTNANGKTSHFLNNKKEKSLKYAMITGDKRYTPDNGEKELALVNKAGNKDGSLCKVVLISMAGSEGLDFKNLRQVHILDPWYNLNRVDQIIGRAIRHCSHKDLPLEQRNCQVFLHGSQTEDNQEECVDVMLYRQAEQKAQKIGAIQKILKSASVDCLIHKDQRKYSKLKQSLPIVLSNKKKIPYDLKDKAYSTICDYGECTYTCFNKLDNGDKEDNASYHYDHTMREKLISKIKMLFTKSHVYKLKDIVAHLETKQIKKVHIYRALSHLVENHNETLVDKFSQKGHLIRIKDLYLFQRDQSNTIMSLQEHMKQLDYKKTSIPYVQYEAKETPSMSSKHLKKVDDVLRNIQEKLDLGMTEQSKDSKGNTFYVNFQSAMAYMEQLKIPVMKAINRIIIKQLLFNHIMEELPFEDELSLIDALYGDSTLGPLEQQIKVYYNASCFKVKNMEFIVLIHLGEKAGNQRKMFVKTETSWEPLQSHHLNTFQANEVKEVLDHFKSEGERELHDVIGFMEMYSSTKKIELKTKLRNVKRNNRGAFFMQKDPQTMKEQLNLVLGYECFSTSGRHKKADMSKIQLIIMMEIILRYLDSIHHENKTYFFHKVENNNENIKLN